MSHTYEVYVDILELNGASQADSAMMTERYEVLADTRQGADTLARTKAKTDHPSGVEFDIRVTRTIH
ncbi:MAG: hypothetical protein AAF268_10275 [Cyanobacteria bacterium P01_A01_bin.3]